MRHVNRIMREAALVVCVLLLSVGVAGAEEFCILTNRDNEPYQLSVRMVDFSGNTRENEFLLNSGYHERSAYPGLLSGYLGEDGYPVNREGVSMASLFADAFPVSGLFPENPEGIWDFDSTQCFASLRESSFVLYRELGTPDGGSSDTLDHGQFLPFNDLTPGVFTALHLNKYDALGNVLPDDDPRKDEPLYAIPAREANHFFGLELDATFTVPPDGRDPQGQEIVASFTADDDLWVYIDGYLVLDLGGIHSAIPGSINFSTGTVTCRGRDGKDYTSKLYKIFRQRYKEQNPQAPERDAEAFIRSVFRENDHWQMVFRDGTEHRLKIIYLERGAGASNLSIRFNFDVMKKK